MSLKDFYSYIADPLRLLGIHPPAERQLMGSVISNDAMLAKHSSLPSFRRCIRFGSTEILPIDVQAQPEITFPDACVGISSVDPSALY
eukprot:3337308-Karenia_brevis.AAC.1